jgi:aspartate aminotransferase
VSAQLSNFARSLSVETAFTVLALARSLKAAGKDVVELEIGDSPFDSTASARAGGMEAIKNNQTHYCPSPGIPEFRAAAAEFVRAEFDVPADAENIVAGAGAKVFQQFFCEAFLNPGDGVLVFSPYFPTFVPNIERRGARAVLTPLKQATGFRPSIADVERFLEEDSSPRAIFLNSPHNPTGGVLARDTVARLSELAVKHDFYVLSDEIYMRIQYEGEHVSPYSFPGMRERTVVLDGHSKTYAMTGWRLGFGVMPREMALKVAKLQTNSNSCTCSFTQIAGIEALRGPQTSVDAMVKEFRARRDLIVEGLNRIEGFRCHRPAGAFYVFPNITGTGMTSKQMENHLMEKAGVAVLAGTAFGSNGEGFIRLSYANSQANIRKALERIASA